MDVAERSKQDPILATVISLAEREPNANKDRAAETWLCILLAWLFENRRSVDDPLGLVEEIYADFEYPKKVAAFVRYMPSDEPPLGTKEQNEERLIRKWGEFVANCRKLHDHTSGPS
jgi:hypothetical protein